MLNLIFIARFSKQSLGASSAHLIEVIGYGRIILTRLKILAFVLNVKINNWI